MRYQSTAVVSDGVRDRVAAAYDEYYAVLRFVAAQRFRIPEPDVRPLIHDVFVAFIRHQESVVDERSWLVAAVCNASRNFWRDKRDGAPPTDDLPDPVRIAEDAIARIDVKRVLARLPARCRAVLWSRYVEGASPDEIAQRYARSRAPGYGRLLVHRCLRAARNALESI